jgi:hypothetical protein
LRYLVRLNPKAFNPLTGKVIVSRLWEVEQCEKIGGNGLVDSKRVIWHCADLRVDKTHVRELFQLPKEGEKPWELEVWGSCVRAQDDAVEIRRTAKDASGN